MPGKQYTVHVVSHTHWDREWYRTQAQFRLSLVNTVDTVLQYFRESPGFRCFLLDGQSILVEDYLELRPEHRDEIRHYVAERRLFIGPWYTQPDEFLVSGESLVRNLQLGIGTARQYGRTMKLGWIPDTFGHISQLPQIFNEFGIGSAALTRGIGDQLPEPRIEFSWRGADGSEVLVLHQLQGYFSAGLLAFPFFWGDTSNIAPSTERATVRVSRLLSSLKQATSGHHLVLWNGADHMPPEPAIAETIDELNDIDQDCHFIHSDVETLAAAVRLENTDRPVITGELRGSRFHPLLYSILSTRTYLKQRNSRIQRLLERYTEPTAALASIVPPTRRDDGSEGKYHYPQAEIREAWKLLLQNHGHDSIGGCSIDQVHREMITRFDQAEQIAERIADDSLHHLANSIDTTWAPDDAPVCVCFQPTGRSGPSTVEHSFRWGEVLQEPLDVVDRTGTARRVQRIAMDRQEHGWLSRRTTVGACIENLPWWQEVLKRMDQLDIPGYSMLLPMKRPGVDDAADEEVEPVVLEIGLSDYGGINTGVLGRLKETLELLDADRPIEIKAFYYRYQIVFSADLSPLSYSAFALRSGGDADSPHVASPEEDAGTADQSGEVSPGEVSEGILHFAGGMLSVAPDASFELTTPEGQRIHGLCRLIDQGDGGDSYDFSPVGAPVELTPIEPPAVTVVETGPVRAALSVSFDVLLPVGLDPERRHRSNETRVAHVVHRILVEEGSRLVRIRTHFTNTAADHRVRAQFSLASRPQREDSWGDDTRALEHPRAVLYADSPFAVEERETAPAGSADWEQQPSSIQPHCRWAAFGDETAAIAVFGDGLHEHEVIETAEGASLELTLFRSVGWLSRGDLSTRDGQAGPMIETPDAQCYGTGIFEYGFRLFASRSQMLSSVHELSEALVRPLTVATENTPERLSRERATPRRNDYDRTHCSLVSLEGTDFILSCCTRATTAPGVLVVRFYNSRPVAVTQQIEVAPFICSCNRARLSEDPVERLHIRNGRITIDAAPFQIVTLLLKPAG